MNLYRPEAQTILLFRECYALEKIHGTSAHVAMAMGSGGGIGLLFHSGGEKHERFVGLFDSATLRERFVAMGHNSVVVYGEAYGGSQQKQAWRYGPQLKFVAFDVRVGDVWLSVPQAADVCEKLGIEFVHYQRVSTDLAALDAERDAPSEQARRNGVAGDQPREGVVLRPIVELTMNNGERVCAKHKRDDERETTTPRKVVDPSQLEVLAGAEQIALEWVTETRLSHVIDKVCPHAVLPENTRAVVEAMLLDVQKEGAGEFVDSAEARVAIKKRAAKMFNERARKVNAEG